MHDGNAGVARSDGASANGEFAYVGTARECGSGLDGDAVGVGGAGTEDGVVLDG